MPSQHKISRAGLELIERFEGLRRTAARLPDGRWTIGYGHTRSARAGAEVSAEDAEALLLFDLAPLVAALNAMVFTPLNQNQFDALVAFAFNVGLEAFRKSDVLVRINEGRLTEAACALDLWRRAEIHGDALVLDALIRRRAAEKALFLTPPGGFVPTPSALVRPERDDAAEPLLPRMRPAEIETSLQGAVAEVRRTGAEPPPATATAIAAEAPPPAIEPQHVPEQSVAQPEPEAETQAVPPHQPSPPAVAPGDIPTMSAIDYFTPPEPANEQDPPHSELIEPTEGDPAALPYPSQPEPDRPVMLAAATAAVAAAAAGLSESAPPAVPVAEAPLEPAPQATAEPQPEPAAAQSDDVAQVPRSHEPASAPAPEAAMPDALTGPSEGPRPGGRATPERASTLRLYGPMGAVGMMAPPAQTVSSPGAQQPPPPAAQAPAPAPAPQEPATTFGPPAVPQASVFAGIAADPAVTTIVRPPRDELVLTPPPEDLDHEPVTPDGYLVPAQSHQDVGAPLFDQAWAGGQADRVILHEETHDLATPPSGPSGLYVLLGVTGLTACAGAIAAFLKGRAGGPGEMTWAAWALALIGVACVAVSVYFLLQRLGGDQER